MHYNILLIIFWSFHKLLSAKLLEIFRLYKIFLYLWNFNEVQDYSPSEYQNRYLQPAELGDILQHRHILKINLPYYHNKYLLTLSQIALQFLL